MANLRASNSPRLDNIRALVTTKWNRGYTTRAISNIETFYVDSSIDNDADTWEVGIGDPNGGFLEMLERNSEVRVELISAAPGAAGHIFTGISDDLNYTQEGLMTVTGRDYASLALDSTVFPCRFKHVRAQYVINKQARQLGFTNVSLAVLSSNVKKVIKTDGSENYWEFWYRLIRNEKMWLWVGPNGALIANKLNYNQAPSYWFGTPQATDSKAIKEQYIPVEVIEIRKSTQTRVGQVYVLYKEKGKETRRLGPINDPTMAGWMKKPTRLLDDKYSHTEKGAKETAWNEIFEGKVGSLEIRLTVSEPQNIIRTNRMAVVRIPEIQFAGQFYIVGWRMQAGSDGYVQEIRLREKNIALSRRIPREPTIAIPNKAPKTNLPGHMVPAPDNEAIMQQMIGAGGHSEWADFFFNAAKKWCNGWDFNTFLAALLSTAYVESAIYNIRQKFGNNGDGTEWFPFEPPPKSARTTQQSGGVFGGIIAGVQGFLDAATGAVRITRDKYEYLFANDQPTASSLGISSAGIGVGPMQLTDDSLKREADDWWTNNREKGPTNHDQYSGGRWRPEANIWVGAERFAAALKSTNKTPDDGAQIDAMCEAYQYYNGSQGTDTGARRAANFKKVMTDTPNFMGSVKDAMPQIRANSGSLQDSLTEGSEASVLFPQGWPSLESCIQAFQSAVWQGQPSKPGATPALPQIPYVPAHYQSSGREGNRAQWIVIHTMEGATSRNNNAAENIANMFGTGNTDGPASAHYTIDRTHIFRCVGDGDTADGVAGTTSQGQSVNSVSLHFEHAGTANYTPADWADDWNTEMLQLSARLTGIKARERGIPFVHLTQAQILAGNPGFVGHTDLNDAFHGGDHWDPGPNFPWIQYLSWAVQT